MLQSSFQTHLSLGEEKKKDLRRKNRVLTVSAQVFSGAAQISGTMLTGPLPVQIYIVLCKSGLVLR